MSEQKVAEGEGVSSADIWKNIPGRGERLCKGPGAGAYLICINCSKETSGVKAVRRTGAGDKVKESADWERIMKDLESHCEESGFFNMRKMRSHCRELSKH